MAAKRGDERTRRRLSTGERREQLLSVGARLFSESPYDDVWIEQVAEIAGVSRGLLYHYFPTKRDFFAAVVERESERMLRMTAAVPGVPVREQLASGLDAFLEHARENARIAEVEIEWHQGDAEALPFGDGSFDVVVSQFGHIFAPRPEVAIAEMLRVLKPGGTVAFTVIRPTLCPRPSYVPALVIVSGAVESALAR